MIDSKPQSTQFAGLRQRLSRTHTAGKTLAAFRRIGCEHVIQFACRILNHGVVDAIPLVGRVGLFAGSRAGNGGIGHCRAGQGSHHKFASFGHNSNLNTQ